MRDWYTIRKRVIKEPGNENYLIDIVIKLRVVMKNKKQGFRGRAGH